MKVVVIGATGAVGRALVAELAGDARVGEIVALARRPVEAPRTRHVPLAGLDVPPEAIPEGARVAFCALGTTIAKAGSEAAFRAVDHDLVLAFARACRARGVEAFHVVTALGADAGSRVFYSRVKGEAERDLEALAFPTLCFYRPSLLVAEREERRAGERAGILVARALRAVLPAKWRAIPAATVARAMARHALAGAHPGAHRHESAELWALAGATP